MIVLSTGIWPMDLNFPVFATGVPMDLNMHGEIKVHRSNACGAVYKQYGTHEIQIKKSNERVIVAWRQNEQFLQLNSISWLNQVTFKQQDNTDDSTCIIR